MRSFKTKTECRCKPPTLMSSFLQFFVHNRHLLCSLDYSVAIIFVLVFTIHNYNLTWIFQKSLTFSRPTNMHVNSIRTQETIHKHFKFSGGTDENVVYHVKSTIRPVNIAVSLEERISKFDPNGFIKCLGVAQQSTHYESPTRGPKKCIQRLEATLLKCSHTSKTEK